MLMRTKNKKDVPDIYDGPIPYGITFGQYMKRLNNENLYRIQNNNFQLI